MGRGVTIAAHDEEAGQGQALLRRHHMHDALARIVEAEQRDAVARRVVHQLADHAGDLGIGNVLARTARGDRPVVGERQVGPASGDRGAAVGELGEGVERSFVHIMAVHPEERVAVLGPQDLVRRPQLVDQGLRFVHGARQVLRRIVIPRRRLFGTICMTAQVAGSGGFAAWRRGTERRQVAGPLSGPARPHPQQCAGARREASYRERSGAIPSRVARDRAAGAGGAATRAADRAPPQQRHARHLPPRRKADDRRYRRRAGTRIRRDGGNDRRTARIRAFLAAVG